MDDGRYDTSPFMTIPGIALFLCRDGEKKRMFSPLLCKVLQFAVRSLSSGMRLDILLLFQAEIGSLEILTMFFSKTSRLTPCTDPSLRCCS